MQKQSFIRGTFTLTASGFFIKILGFINVILLSRFLGAEGVGLLMMAHPLVPLVITLTELGLPVAISKLISEVDVQKNPDKVRQILAVSLLVTGTLSIVLTLLSLFGSGMVADIFLTDRRAYDAMLAITPIAPIIAVSAVLKGYFRGKQDMRVIALSEIIEHSVQILCIIFLVPLLVPYGIAVAAAGAMIGSVLGEGAGLVFILIMFRLSRLTSKPDTSLFKHVHEGKKTLYELLYIGLPTAGNGFIHSIYRAFLPMLVTSSLIIFGLSTQSATKEYGLLFGYVFPLLFLPGFITQSLFTALIPAISEAQSSRNNRLMHRRMDQAMRIALFVGAPSTIILFIWAVPLTTVIYHAPEAGALLKILAPVFFLDYFEAPLHAILLGLGRATTAMWNFVLTNVFEACAIFIFASKLGIHGVAIGFAFGIFLLTFLNLHSISKIIGFYFDLRTVVRAGFAVSVMSVCGSAVYSFMKHLGTAASLNLAVGISCALMAYAAALMLSSGTSRGDQRVWKIDKLLR